jgi:hypothetical protein
MKATSILFLFLIVLNAFASCPEMAKKSVSKYKKSNAVTSSTYATFADILRHYRNEMRPEGRPAIESVSAYIKGRKLTGFEVIVTDGGDESKFRYVLNEKKEIIVAYWYNQSPMTYWFCGENTSPESEYTNDGSEI